MCGGNDGLLAIGRKHGSINKLNIIIFGKRITCVRTCVCYLFLLIVNKDFDP